MPLTLISATPSPYARKVRISLALKGIPFTLQNEIPWESSTKTPNYNPLEQLPVLILEDGSAVYDSHFILDYIELKYPSKLPLISADVDEKLLAKQIELVCDGVYDAIGRYFFEKARGEKASPEWESRQLRKIVGGTKAVAEWVKAAKERGDEYLVGNQLSIADLAVVTLCGMLTMTESIVGDLTQWKGKYPEMVEYEKKVGARKEFSETSPVMFDLQERVV